MSKTNIQNILSPFLDICILEIDENGDIKDVVLNTKKTFTPKKAKNIYRLFTKEDQLRAERLLQLGLSQKKTFMELNPKYGLDEYVDVEVTTQNGKMYAGLRFFESRREREIEYDRRIEDFAQKAEIDELTGLLNRHGYWKRIKGVLNGEDPERQLGILMIDVDNLKGVNDKHGHDGGDRAISNISALIRESIRVRDIAVRYGGDEFVVVVEELTGKYSTAYGLAKRLNTQISNSKKTLTTVSIGVHIVRVGDFSEYANNEARLEAEWRDAVNVADKMAYKAKEKGKNRVECSENVRK